MILEITDEHIQRLSDTDLRTLVAYLCESEVAAHGHSVASVTWGGHQNAPDGGIDVRVALPADAAITGYVPRPQTGFQSKAQDMANAAIHEEMAPDGVILPSIVDLANKSGAYVIVSSKGSLADTALSSRRAAMAEAVKSLPNADKLTLDFYDRRRLASWVNLRPGLVPWVRQRLGESLSGWRPFDDWSSSPSKPEAPYLLDDQLRLFGPSIEDADGLAAEKALGRLRGVLARPKGVVRLVGLSGVGKTRLMQALFDESVGTGALHKSDALYTDMSDTPDPVPQEMLARLIAKAQRAVLIVDNCPSDLHTKLAERVSNSNSAVSIITVEYDINDDEPAHTDVFRLEPASLDLIEKVLAIRYPNLSQPSRHAVSKFSEGNARIALALAATSTGTDSLALKDSELFKRLFHQQKAHNEELLDAATALALLYSFDGESLEGDESELAILAKASEMTVPQLHKHAEELYRRKLVQKRSKWRAILPHALANRLAKRALENIPAKHLEDSIVAGPSPRVLVSFSRRLGYLHDSERAAAVAASWLTPDGLLGRLGELNSVGEDVFENIAPTNMQAALTLIEKAAEQKGASFFSKENINRDSVIRVVRAIAYEPEWFDRCAALLLQFLLSEPDGNFKAPRDSLCSLFWLHLSATHAPISQRAAFVRKLLESNVAAEQDVGLVLLGELLKTSHSSPSHSFEFGAWKRDFGLHPSSSDEVRQWFSHTIGMIRDIEASGVIDASRVRHVAATHFRELLRIGMLDELAALATIFADPGGWPEGWIGARGALRRLKDDKSSERYAKLTALEELLRPNDLPSRIRAYALTKDYGPLDIVDLEEEVESNHEARLKLEEYCKALGKELAREASQLEAMLPEIISSESQKTFSLGRGLAEACESLDEVWLVLRHAFLGVPDRRRNGQVVAGFLSSALARSPEKGEELLDRVLSEEAMHTHFVWWQAVCGLNGRAFGRLLAAANVKSVPVNAYCVLATGRSHEGLGDEEFDRLMRAILGLNGGSEVAAEIIGMRFYGRISDKLEVSEAMRATGRWFLSTVDAIRSDRSNHLTATVIRSCYDLPQHEEEVRALCSKIATGLKRWSVSGWDMGEVMSALAEKCPIPFLDILVEELLGEDGETESPFEDIRGFRTCPLHPIAEEVWRPWADQRPETRYKLLARVVRYCIADEGEGAGTWSQTAAALIENAPRPIEVLNTLQDRFWPNSWSGSRAAIVEQRIPLLTSLKEHKNADIAAWAGERAAALAVDVAKEREHETRRSRMQDERFE